MFHHSKLKDVLIIIKLGGNRKPLLALLSCISLGLTMGITEEYIFRGILQAELGQKLGDTAGVMVTAAFLGLLQRDSPGFINNIVVFQFLELVEGITELLGLQFF